MKRVSLEDTTKRFMGPRGLFAVIISIAIVVAFGFWCDNVKKQEDNKVAGADYLNAVENRTAAFQGAVIGFLLLFAVKHLREDF